MTGVLLSELAQKLQAKLDENYEASVIHSVATLEHAAKGQISFLSNAKYRRYLSETTASAVLIKEDDLPFVAPGTAAIIVADPYVAFAKVAQLLDTTPQIAVNIHESAIIADTAVVASDAAIGPNVVIGAGAVIGSGVQIGAGSYIGENVQLGDNSRLWANTTLYHGVRIGRSCLIHSGAVIGADGFGFANERGNWLKIPQTGTVVIGDHCEIGANTTIDRGAIENTVIGNNVIIDNQCQIAHNVRIGDHTAIAGCTVVAGSVNIGRYCVIGGAAVINGHISICDGAHISGMAMLMKPVTEKGVYTSGIPAVLNAEWRKNTARLRQIEQLYQRVKILETELARLDSAQSAKIPTED